MDLSLLNQPANWRVSDLEQDKSWIFHLDEQARRDLTAAILKAGDPKKALLAYRRQDFELGSAWCNILAALNEVKYGRGIAIVRGLPRDGLDEKQFELLTWAIGLHAGVPRPQGKATQYISAVRNAGVAYRTGTGRGYSSNAELDFHTDSSDLVFLSCYNKAVAGGKTIVSSSLAAHDVMAHEYPEQLNWLYQPIGFSRQGEEAPGEGPYVMMPVFSKSNGKWFGRWNWNRVRSAQKIVGVPQINPEHFKVLEQFDAVVRRPDVAFEMWLEPGDLQIINSHVTLHSRTEFEDHDDETKRRLLFRLWIAPPGSDILPECWRDLYRTCEPGQVRGGIRGHQHDEACLAFETRQAAEMGMQMYEVK